MRRNRLRTGLKAFGVASFPVFCGLVSLEACAPTDQMPTEETTVATSSAAATSGGFGGASGLGGAGGQGVCVSQKLDATLEKKPIDLIIIVDTSGSMAPASDAVEQNINTNLAQILEASGLDYRVIALAAYGSGDLLCVGPPLGGADCNSPPPTPANTTRFFQYDKGTGSAGVLQTVLDWYDAPDDSGAAPNGWKDWVRPNSQKVFLLFSDTASGSNDPSVGDDFDTGLLARDPAMFGTADARAYTFDAIIGLKQSSPATAPWLSTDPMVSGTCSGLGHDLGAGKSIQEVSIVTGGLRFPVCQYASFDVVFQTIADSVVNHTVIDCDIAFPMPPNGQTIDPNTVQVDYTPSDGSPVVSMHQVTSSATCEPDAFFIESQTIHLCPAACTTVQADEMAQVAVQFGCDVGFAK